jgi:uncharacterized protein (DUF2236 family)
VSRQDLERTLSELRAETLDPSGGIYGPESLAWEIGRESALFLGGGKAALLQLAHPFVAYAIEQHSKTTSDPLGRFRRTFDGVFRMVFGDLDQAFGAARRVHSVHDRVLGKLDGSVGAFAEGTPYRANDGDALLWVYATLVATAVEVYDLVVRPLGYAERDRYLYESRRFARLFGIPERLLPTGWSGFTRYYSSMLRSDVIRVAPPARKIKEFLFTARSPIEEPFVRLGRLMTAGLMPERLRTEFGLRYSPMDRRAFAASVLALRTLYPRLPGRLRFVPAYRAACRRVAAALRSSGKA